MIITKVHSHRAGVHGAGHLRPDGNEVLSTWLKCTRVDGTLNSYRWDPTLANGLIIGILGTTEIFGEITMDILLFTYGYLWDLATPLWLNSK